jgi:hypothetical protein
MLFRCNQFELGKEVHKLDCMLAKLSFESPDSCGSAKMSAIEQLIQRSKTARNRDLARTGFRRRVGFRCSHSGRLVVRTFSLRRLLTGVGSPKWKTRMPNVKMLNFLTDRKISYLLIINPTRRSRAARGLFGPDRSLMFSVDRSRRCAPGCPNAIAFIP